MLWKQLVRLMGFMIDVPCRVLQATFLLLLGTELYTTVITTMLVFVSRLVLRIPVTIMSRTIPDCPDHPIGIILGTGWGDTITLHGERSLSLSWLPFFRGLRDIHGHSRRLSFGYLEQRPVVLVRGRMHLNECVSTPRIEIMWRAVIDALFALGVRKLVTTAAVGGLGQRASVNDIVVIDRFYAPSSLHLGLFTGEFVLPDSILKHGYPEVALTSARETGFTAVKGGYAFFLGPNFESEDNKRAFEAAGNICVGMSTLPEVAYFAVNSMRGHPVMALYLAFVTNGEGEHSHPDNVERAQKKASDLGRLLSTIMREM